MMIRQHCVTFVNLLIKIYLCLLAGSKFPFVNNNMQQQQQNPMQSNQQWPGMHMGFNQNSNDGGFPHPNNQQQQQQHKPAGKIIWILSDFSVINMLFFNNFQDLETASQNGAHYRSIQQSCHFVNFPNSTNKDSNRAAMITLCHNWTNSSNSKVTNNHSLRQHIMKEGFFLIN